jgi:hypothetical protein
MSALGQASLGTQCADPAVGMASLGVFCEVTVIVRQVGGKKGGRQYPLLQRNFKITDPNQTIPLEDLVREDEELLAVIVAGIQIGLIK